MARRVEGFSGIKSVLNSFRDLEETLKRRECQLKTFIHAKVRQPFGRANVGQAQPETSVHWRRDSRGSPTIRKRYFKIMSCCKDM